MRPMCLSVCVSEMEIQHPWNEFAVENMPLWCKREFAGQKATVTLPVSRPGWKINSCDADKNGSCFRKHIIPKRTADHLNWSVSQSVSQSSQSAWCGSRVSFQAITGKTTPQHFLSLSCSERRRLITQEMLFVEDCRVFQLTKHSTLSSWYPLFSAPIIIYKYPTR